jgi:hypothetical protein
VFLDFDTTAGQRAWLDHAQQYGGVYLVGNRWLLSAKSAAYMETLRAKFGGSVEDLDAYACPHRVLQQRRPRPCHNA